jgi:hypothetical protein
LLNLARVTALKRHNFVLALKVSNIFYQFFNKLNWNWWGIGVFYFRRLFWRCHCRVHWTHSELSFQLSWSICRSKFNLLFYPFRLLNINRMINLRRLVNHGPKP